MVRQSKVVVITFLILLLSPSLLPADLIVIKSGDRFFGKIQNRHFALDSTNGQIVLQNDFLKSISFDANNPGHATCISINNDRFSGSVLNDEFEIVLENGALKSIEKNHVERLRIDTRGTSYKIITGIFTMENNDKFSGKLLNPELKINADYMLKLIKSDAINRIEFLHGEPNDVKILLSNGNLIRGDLDNEEFEVLPEVIGRLTLGKQGLRSIQLNASKMVLKEFHSLPESDRDSDGDGVADNADKCPNSPWGFEVDQNGCSKDPNLAMDAGPLERSTPVFFEFDGYNLQARYHSNLDNIVSTLKAIPSMNIQIQGHTDNIGTPEYNMSLSEKRAREVKRYIVNKNIDDTRIATIGYGATKNKTTNATPDGRAQNRRVEIVFLK